MANQCDERHEPKFKVTYKPTKGQVDEVTWLVCSKCIEGKNFFGDKNLILSIEEID